MKIRNYIFISLFSCVALPVVPAAVAGPTLGDCGSSWAQRLGIRDSWGNANFAPACRTHDRCYAACGAERHTCDNRFKSMMRESCKSSYSSQWHTVQRASCLKIANAYHSAVHRMGGDAYRAAQRNCKLTHGRIINKHYGKCLNLHGKDNKNAGSPGVWNCSNHADQTWDIEPAGNNNYKIVNKTHGKCLNLQKKQNIKGGKPDVWHCNSNRDQLWQVIVVGGGYVRLKSTQYQRCLNLQKKQNKDDGKPNVWNCVNHPDQLWKLEIV